VLVRVYIEEAADDPPLPAWKRDHEAMISELHRELAEKLPAASYLEFWFGENGRQGQGRIMQRPGCPPDNPARRKQDLTSVDMRLGPVDLPIGSAKLHQKRNGPAARKHSYEGDGGSPPLTHCTGDDRDDTPPISSSSALTILGHADEELSAIEKWPPSTSSNWAS
jgi:hypothetical protein